MLSDPLNGSWIGKYDQNSRMICEVAQHSSNSDRCLRLVDVEQGSGTPELPVGCYFRSALHFSPCRIPLLETIALP